MSASELLAIDEASRRRALEVASFIVEAPAGAGKTELLTQRYLRLLATVNEPEEIIAITFTNKAAAEMRTRILNNLTAAMQPVTDPLAAHQQITRELALAALIRDAELGWDLLANPSRLRITTIDSLSASLARQMPLLSRFGAQPAVTDKAQTHYEAAAQRTLALLEDRGNEGRSVEAALRYFDNDTQRLQKLLVEMLKRRDQWLGHVVAADAKEGDAFSFLVALDLQRARAVLDEKLQSQLIVVGSIAAENLIAANSDSSITALTDWDAPLTGDLPELALWRGIAALLLTDKGEWRKALNVRQGIPPGKEGKTLKDALAACIEALARVSGAEATLARIQQLPAPVLDAEEARIVGVFSQLLKLAAAQLWTVFQQQREVDFIEVAQRALLALGGIDEPSNLQLKLDYRISHLLVDEFQDTSPAQIQLLTMLTAGWQAGDGRTLFVVGDPMQSIYRFRKADVGLFLQAKLSGIGGVLLESLRLNRNNRSHPEVVAWINESFPGIFPPADNPQSGAVKFAPSVATKPPLSASVAFPLPLPAREWAGGDGDGAQRAGVVIHPILTGKDGESADIDEARQIIAILLRERAAHPAASIAILVRVRNHLNTLVMELRRSAPELRYQAVEIERLAQRQVIQDLLSLTRALHHRADRLNWLAVLRAPWCGLVLADLHALAADDHQSTIWQLMNDEVRVTTLSADGQRRLCHVRAVFAEALAHQGRLRTRRWVEAVWRMLGGEACLHDAAERADAKAYWRLLDGIDSSAGFTLDRLDKEIALLYAAPVADAPGEAQMIQIMTVHKSKGLEFDTVILPGLHRAPRHNDSSLLLWEEFVDGEGRDHLVIAPVKQRRNRDDKTPSAYDYLRALDAEREANESSRVLYVAATRAIRALHLLAVATVDRHSGEACPRMPEAGSGNPGVSDLTLKLPAKGTPLAALWPKVEADFNAALSQWQGSEQNDVETNSLAAFVPKLTRLAAPAIPAYLQHDTAALESIAQYGNEDTGESASDDRALRTDIGTLAHRMLELIAQDSLDQWSARRVRSMHANFKHWLQAKGHLAATLDAAATQVMDAVCTAISADAGRWILASRDGAANELALTSNHGGKVVSQVIDRTFVENGERWIIDYKTARFDVDAAESELKAHAETHRPQLERYAALFADADLPVRRAVFFIAQGRLVELS